MVQSFVVKSDSETIPGVCLHKGPSSSRHGGTLTFVLLRGARRRKTRKNVAAAQAKSSKRKRWREEDRKGPVADGLYPRTREEM